MALLFGTSPLFDPKAHSVALGVPPHPRPSLLLAFPTLFHFSTLLPHLRTLSRHISPRPSTRSPMPDDLPSPRLTPLPCHAPLPTGNPFHARQTQTLRNDTFSTLRPLSVPLLTSASLSTQLTLTISAAMVLIRSSSRWFNWINERMFMATPFYSAPKRTSTFIRLRPKTKRPR